MSIIINAKNSAPIKPTIFSGNVLLFPIDDERLPNLMVATDISAEKIYQE